MSEGYDFVLSSRLQTDPLERRFGQYRQMSGGRFLVSLKDTLCSEKILKIKSLLKVGVDVDENVKENEPGSEEVDNLLRNIDALNISIDNMKLSTDSREVAVHISGYIAKKFIKKKHACCKDHLTGKLSEDNEDHNYIRILSRGGLTIPSVSLTDYVCSAFSVLSLAESTIIKSSLRSRRAAEITLSYIFESYQEFTCTEHVAAGQRFTHRVVSNIYFNNKRKTSTAAVIKDNVTSFKKRQRETNVSK